MFADPCLVETKGVEMFDELQITLQSQRRVGAGAVKWGKPLSARLQPVLGKKAGEQTDFQDPYLFNTTVHPLP